MMSSSWSDQDDLTADSDLTLPDSQSQTSKCEFGNFDDHNHHAEDNLDCNDNEISKERHRATNQNLPTGRETSHNSTGNVKENNQDSPKEGKEDPDRAPGSLKFASLEISDQDGGKQHTVLNMHHVDLILDNIDAELNDIISRSRNSEHSDHSFHGNSTSSNQARSNKTSPAAVTLVASGNVTADEQDNESASDTGLGSSSQPGDSGTALIVDHMSHGSAQEVTDQKNGVDVRMNEGRQRSAGKQKGPRRPLVLDASDADSISSEDVRLRIEQTFILQGSGTNAPPSRHSHNPLNSHNALQKHHASTSHSGSAVSSEHSPFQASNRPAKTNRRHKDEASHEQDDNRPSEISSRIQEMVWMALSDSASEPIFPESNTPDSHSSSSQNPEPSHHKTPGLVTHQTMDQNSLSFVEYRQAGQGFDADSIATEDFEHVFQKSIISHEPSSRKSSNSSQKKKLHDHSSSSPKGDKSPSISSVRKTDHLTVPRVRRGKPRNRKKRSTTLPTSNFGGLPEHELLRKGITKNNNESDSIRADDYETQFEVAGKVFDDETSSKYASVSNLSQSGLAVNVQSDPESIQTEEYEQRFRSLVVKQVAGVPVKSFDQVTIPSDLESVETGMVHEKFLEALNKGPEVRVFDEYGDQSDLESLQQDKTETFQTTERQKRRKMKHYHQASGDESEDDETSDLDSVRAIPSKSETGSPPERRNLNSEKNSQKFSNGIQPKHSHNSRDHSPRASAFSSTRSSPRVPSSPIRYQLASPRSTQDANQNPPQQSPMPATASQFPFGQPPVLVNKPCKNHDMKMPQRPGQANYPSWQDPSVGRQRAAAWNAQRQDSYSTYEEVESLHSHQCSSLQSLDNSCGPSRLQSFGSTSSSLDQPIQQVESSLNGSIPVKTHLYHHEKDDQDSSLESESIRSASADSERPDHFKEKSRRSLIEDDDDKMNSSVAKWVDQTRVETARRRSHAGLPEDPPVRSHEAPDGGQQSHNQSKDRSLNSLKMQCGDVIAGKSGHRIRLPHETDLELALRVENASPSASISRCASMDSSHSSGGSDQGHLNGNWTVAEDVLLNLGFGGSNMGIPDRFLKSWREKLLKRRIEEVRRLFGNSASNHLLQYLPGTPEKSPSPKRTSPPGKEDVLNQKASVPLSAPLNSKPASTLPSVNVNSPQHEDAVMSKQHGTDKAKLIGLRRSLKKAATVSSFGQTLAEISKQVPHNQQPCTTVQQANEQPPAARRSPGGGKYNLFHKPHKSSARDRRRKYLKKQSSLPISLETLEEEDESLKPVTVKCKQSEKENAIPTQKHLKPQSLELGDEPLYNCKLKIVMEQPSIESREAMSRQGTTDVDVDEAIADVDTDKKEQPVSMEQYLVVKSIIDSKDSGFENEPSRIGSPQTSPRSSEDENLRGTNSKTVTAADSTLRRTESTDCEDNSRERHLVISAVATRNSDCIVRPSSSDTDTIQAQPRKQKETSRREEIDSKSAVSTQGIATSTRVNSEPTLRTEDYERKGSRCSLSASSDKRRPSLAELQDDFYHAVVEDDVFSLLKGIDSSESVSACCQTSPTLHSPLLSPLFFHGSVSEYSDGILEDDNSDKSIFSEIFASPDELNKPSEMNQESSSERHNLQESTESAVDGPREDSSQSQEISDGGLSIIAEKEEPVLCQETSSQTATTNDSTGDSQEPLKIDIKTAILTSQNLFQFNEQQRDLNPLSPNTVQKSRNPFKSSESFSSSPNQSRVDFDFDATIEEGEDGEQYSDGESFSKVSFPEVTTMTYKKAELHTFNTCPKNDALSSSTLERDLEPSIYMTNISEFKVEKTGTTCQNFGNNDSPLNNNVHHLNENRVLESQNMETNHGEICNDGQENSNQQIPESVTFRSKQTNLESRIPSMPEIKEDSLIKNFDGLENEEGHELNKIGCSSSDIQRNFSDQPNLDKNDSTTDEHTHSALFTNASGSENKLDVPEGQNDSEQSSNENEDTIKCTDYDITTGDDIIDQLSSKPESKIHLNVANKYEDTSPIQCSFLSSIPHGKESKFSDYLEWNVGFDPPPILRSTSVEAHLSFQRRKLRTLSERSTLYSDGMEPLLQGFGRVLTERSSASTEGFGSYGSDAFQRPLTVTQTLQQVVAKLKSHIRQQSLVSIQDEESEEEPDLRSEDEKATLTKQKGNPHNESLSLEEGKLMDLTVENLSHGLVNERNTKMDEGSKDVKDKTISNANNSCQTIQTSKSIINRNNELGTIPEMSNALPAVNVDTIIPDAQRDEPSTPELEPNKPNLPNQAESCRKPSTNASKSRRRSWQFQASASRKSSNFLCVPSFGPLSNSDEETHICSTLDSHLCMSREKEVGEESEKCEEDDTVAQRNPNSTQSQNVQDQELYIPSPHSSATILNQMTGSRVGRDNSSLTNSLSQNGLTSCLEVEEKSSDNDHKNFEVKDSTKLTVENLESSTSSFEIQQSSSPSKPLIKEDIPEHIKNAVNRDQSEDAASLTAQNPVLEPQNKENSNPASDVVFINLLPPNGLKQTREDTAVHSQFYRSEKFLNVSTSSEGKVHFLEPQDDSDDSNDSKACTFYQIPTFLSEVQFYPSSSSPDLRLICSQSNASLDCPAVSTPRWSPTFEEICSKAGCLMHQLQEALASRAPSRQRLPVRNSEEVEQREAEEEGDSGRNVTNLSSGDDTDRLPHTSMRMKQGSKKSRSRGFGEVKTSTPKRNDGAVFHSDLNLELNTDSVTSNDHQATFTKLFETETKMRRKLDKLNSSYKDVFSMKEAALSDLKVLREAVHRNKRNVQKAEEIARENMERADGLRSELMVLEYQRDQARRDLEDLTQSISAIKQSEEDNSGTGSDALGLSHEEVMAVIKERDELKMRVRNGEGDLSPIERSELERQLNYAKQELFNGQKSARAKVESLQEELDESRHRMEALRLEKMTLAEKVRELQSVANSEHGHQTYADMEERNQLLEELCGKLQKELDTLQQQTYDKEQLVQSLTATVAEKDKLNEALRDKMVRMEREVDEGRTEVERVAREAEGKVRNADVVKELALVELRETLLREKEEEMDQLRLSLEKDKKEALAALDERTSEMMVITQRSLTEKENDLKSVKQQLLEQTEESNKMVEQLQKEAQEQIKAAVDKERKDRKDEYERKRREENVEKEVEVAKETSRLQGELHVARQSTESLQTTVTVLKEELNKLREENLAAGREKVEAVSEAREQARRDIQRELDQLKEQLAKENLLEMDKLRLKLRQQEEELTKLRSEVKVHREKEARSLSVTGSKSILAEINEECKRTAAVIGSASLKMTIPRVSKSLNGTTSPRTSLSIVPDPSQNPGRTQVMAALTNLRISNEELRNYTQSLKTDLGRQKRAVTKAQKEKDEEAKKITSAIERKSEDMESLRDRLVQDHMVQVEELQQQLSHRQTTESILQQRLLDKDSELREIQQNMTQWKEETALKMAKKFEEELSKELEIRLQESSKRDGSYRGSQSDLGSRHSSDNASPSTNSSAGDASTIRLLKHLQERVQQLRTENMSLRRSNRGLFDSPGEDRGGGHSSKSNGNGDKEHLLYQLQQRVKLLERQLQVAEERCRENAASVSEKASENNRLQVALTQQTKELMRMERAYSKLASPPRTLVRL